MPAILVELPTIIAFVEGVINEIPAAVTAYNNIKAAIASGGQITQEQWNAAMADIDAANAAVQAAEPPTA